MATGEALTVGDRKGGLQGRFEVPADDEEEAGFWESISRKNGGSMNDSIAAAGALEMERKGSEARGKKKRERRNARNKVRGGRRSGPL